MVEIPQHKIRKWVEQSSSIPTHEVWSIYNRLRTEYEVELKLHVYKDGNCKVRLVNECGGGEVVSSELVTGITTSLETALFVVCMAYKWEAEPVWRDLEKRNYLNDTLSSLIRWLHKSK